MVIWGASAAVPCPQALVLEAKGLQLPCVGTTPRSLDYCTTGPGWFNSGGGLMLCRRSARFSPKKMSGTVYARAQTDVRS